MPSNVHARITAPSDGYPETPTEAGPRNFYLGVLAHLKLGEPEVMVRFNGDEADEVILCPGSTRVIGRRANRPIQTFQVCSLGEVDGTVTLEFTEEAQPDELVWHAGGPEGPAGPAGPQGEQGPAGDSAATVRVRALVGANPINVLAGATADLVADSADINAGSAYDPNTGVVTVPAGEAGDYLLMATALTFAAELELEAHTSADGGANWTSLALGPKCVNGARIADLVSLADGVQLKFIVRNPTGAAVDVLGSAGNQARSYIAVTKVA